MQKSNKGSCVFSPSDLTRYMRSPFADWVTRLKLENPSALEGIEKDQDALMGLLAEQGNKHEQDYLNKLIADHGVDNVAVINEDRQTAYTDTIQAMQAGKKVIYQALLKRDNFAGYADFLIKREGTSALGDYYYEAWDTKRANKTKPYFVVQLCCYSWMLDAIQNKLPDEVVVVLGNQEDDRIRIAAHYSYFLSLKQQFLSAHEMFTGNMAQMPDPALCTDHGEWGDYAKQLMSQSDSLALVANIRKSQIKKLHDAGIRTLSSLAQCESNEIKGNKDLPLAKIKAQAEIQLQSRGLEKPKFKLLDKDGGKKLTALPPLSEFDVFFDIEGYTLVEGGLEYLWGISYYGINAPQGKQYAFKDWWAHDQEQEKLAFQGFINWVYQRWQDHPDLHIYHYASYETTAIRKLSNRYQSCITEVEDLLKNGVFIDLYKIVKNGLLIGEPKYSIKNVEHIYRGKRLTEVASGGDSVVVYDNWRDLGGVEDWEKSETGYQSWCSNPDHFDWTQWSLLKGIRDYNIDDCESTLELVAWLRELQHTNNIAYHKPSANEPDESEQSEKSKAAKEIGQALAEWQQKLIDRFENDPQLKQDAKAELLASLLQYFVRENKPKIRTYYERLEKVDDELFYDEMVVHDLTLTNSPSENGKLLCTATYDKDQPLRTDKITSATVKGFDDIRASNITFKEVDIHHGEIQFTIATEHQEVVQLKPLTLLGDGDNINTINLENRLCNITERYFESKELTGALTTLLEQNKPKFLDNATPLPINRELYPDNTDYLDAITKAVQAMDHTCLCIQGPPGSGKTYTASYVIKKLVSQEKRVGITSNSHTAIMNLLKLLSQELKAIKMAKVGDSSKKNFRETFPADDYPCFDYWADIKAESNYKIIGATTFAFAKDIAYQNPLDYLFVDEASQLSLAHLVAASGAAKNIVLMGDQMQLENVMQGVHPGQSGMSALDFLMQAHHVIPEDKGIFLERTFRMHPAICQPLSDVVYDGKLQADEANRRHAINIPQPKLINRSNGIVKLTVPHEGNRQSSKEEAAKIQQLIDELKTGSFTDKQQNTRPLTDQDILVVAPYNMQVNLLKEKLKGNLAIGTIDKFQGQEAPVVIISMAISDVDESPRGLDFVFDINRLNVAISRAQALAIVVANAGLERCTVSSLGQMERVGFYCKLKNEQ
jgi:predicted RecB family nuclease